LQRGKKAKQGRKGRGGEKIGDQGGALETDSYHSGGTKPPSIRLLEKEGDLPMTSREEGGHRYA